MQLLDLYASRLCIGLLQVAELLMALVGTCMANVHDV